MNTEETDLPYPETRIENLRKALGDLVGVNTKEELDGMEEAMSLFPASRDKTSMINAIHALQKELKFQEQVKISRFPYRMPNGTAEAIISRSIGLLEATPAGKKALAHMLEGLLEFGEDVSNHVFEDKRGDQAEAFCDLLVVAITYGCTQEAFEQIKAHVRGQ